MQIQVDLCRIVQIHAALPSFVQQHTAFCNFLQICAYLCICMHLCMGVSCLIWSYILYKRPFYIQDYQNFMLNILTLIKFFFFVIHFSKLFANLKEIKNSLLMDPLLQRSILFVMQPSHYALVIQSGYFNHNLFLEMVAHHTRLNRATRNEVICLCMQFQ